MHELTHEIQKQQGGNSRFLATEQDRFMTNKMMEAEARLNTAKAGLELYNQLPMEKREEFFTKLDRQTRTDMLSYMELSLQRLPEEAINREMLKKFYQDPQWNEGYNQQALYARNYRMTRDQYYLEQSQDTEKVQMAYMERMGLGKEEAAYFFNPDNIACYPRDRVKDKSETMVPIIGCDKKQKVVQENGEVVQKVIYDKDNNILSEERVINDYTTCRKTYDAKGNIDRSITIVSMGDKQYQTIKEKGKFLCEIEIENGKITGIYDADHKMVMNKEDVEKQSKIVKDTFGKILEGKSVDDQTLLEATSIALKDEYGIYSSSVALKSIRNIAF